MSGAQRQQNDPSVKGSGESSTTISTPDDLANFRRVGSKSNTVHGEGTPTITYVEFFCGIGGWTMALEEAYPGPLERLAALDHSDLCRHVFQHNFGENCYSRASIEALTQSQLEEWNATVWAMSPPCQPFTRQHENQHLCKQDPRAKGFLHLCDLLEAIDPSKLPHLLLMENVVGFESSASCQRWREVLSKRTYHVGHFHFTPTQMGVPNDRPRYYCVAVLHDRLKQPCKFVELESNLLTSPPHVQASLPELGIESESTNNTDNLVSISNFLDDTIANRDDLRIPEKLLESRAAWCFDIVSPSDCRSACFTQSYGKFIRGTGSVLWAGGKGTEKTFQLVSPDERDFDPHWKDGLDLQRNLRYFSGVEIAKLMGFPTQTFSFPDDCSTRQQWKLLGNSLNVKVAACVTQLGLCLLQDN